MSLDTQLFLLIQEFTGNPLIDGAALLLAEYLVFLIPITLTYLWFESESSRRDSVFTLIATVTGIGLTYVLGLFYFHNQPFANYETIVSGGELDNAFPSQHTTAVLSCFWSFLYLKRNKLAWIFGASGVLTGFTRVFVGLHYPLDILGALFAGFLGLGSSVLIFNLSGKQIDNLIEKISELEKKATEYLLTYF